MTTLTTDADHDAFQTACEEALKHKGKVAPSDLGLMTDVLQRREAELSESIANIDGPVSNEHVNLRLERAAVQAGLRVVRECSG